MGDRFVVIVVSLLTLIVMCGLLYAAVVWVPGRLGGLEARLDRIEDQKVSIDMTYDEVKHLDAIREKLSEAARTGTDTTALARIDARVDELTTKMKIVVPEVNRIAKLPKTDDINRLERKLNELSAKVSVAAKGETGLKRLAAELTAMKSAVLAAQKVLEKKVNDLGSELKRINLQIQKLEAQVKRIQTSGS